MAELLNDQAIDEKTDVFTDQSIDQAIEAEETLSKEQAEAEFIASASPVLSRDDFFSFFKSVFAAGSAVSGLNSLVIQEDETGARLASDKLYNILEGSPVLRKLIENGGVLCLDWFIILSWAGKKAVACVAEKAGTDTAGAVQKIAERAGNSFAGGVLNRLMFWRKKN